MMVNARMCHQMDPGARALLQCMVSDRSGTVAVFFAVVFVVMLGAGGLAIDMASYGSAKDAGRRAADAAALAALSPSTPRNVRAQRARDVFEANLPTHLSDSITQFNIRFTEHDGVETAEVTFALEAALVFGRAYGGEDAIARGQVAASVNRSPKIDVALWLDGSASMGVAADEGARDRLRALSRSDPEHKNCAFACHMPTRLHHREFPTSMHRARANRVPLRVDVMRSAVDRLILALKPNNRRGANVRFSLASFHSRFEMLRTFTNNRRDIRRAVRTFDLTAGMPWGDRRLAASRLSETFASGATELLASPNAEGARRAVVIATDGMQFDWNSYRPGPIDPSVCQPLKDEGVIVAVVQLRYVELNGDGAFNTWVRPHFHLLGPALEACASPGFFFSADTPAEIEDAFNRLAISLQASLRLTQ